MKKIFLLFFFVTHQIASSQTIQVLNQEHQPIASATVSCSNTTYCSITNKSGQIVIDPNICQDSLTIQHLSYETKTVTFNELQKLSYKIVLDKKKYFMNEVVISASSWEERLSDIPGSIRSINPQQPFLSQSQTTADLVNNASGTYIQKSQQGGGSPMLRGFGGNRVLTMVDGVRLNNAILRSGNNQQLILLDPFNLGQSEVYFGTGVALYGSDAIGGVIDLRTLPLIFADSDTQPKIYGKAQTRYTTYNRERTFNINLGYATKKWAMLTAFSHSTFGDLQQGTRGPEEYLRPDYQTTINGVDTVLPNQNPNLQYGSGYNQYNILHKMSYRLSKNTAIAYTFLTSQSSNIPRYDRLIARNNANQLQFSEWYYGPQKWSFHKWQFKQKKETILFSAIDLYGSVQLYSESRHDRRFGRSLLSNRFERVHIYSLNGNLEKNLSESLKLFYGFESTLNKIGSNAFSTNKNSLDKVAIQTRYPDASNWQSNAVYVAFRKHFSTKLILSGGIRINSIVLSATIDTSFTKLPENEVRNMQVAPSGQVGLVYIAKNSLRYFVNAGTGFRAPNIDDVGKIFDSQPGLVTIPNSNLKEERAWSTEVGGTFINKAGFEFSYAGYFTFLQNAITRAPFTYIDADSILYDGVMHRVLALQNSSSAHVFGIEVTYRYRVYKKLELLGNLNVMHGTEKDLASDNKLPISHISPPFGQLILNYSIKKYLLGVSSRYNWSMPYNRLPISEKTAPHLYAIDNDGQPWSPSWVVFNLLFSYRNDRFSGSIMLENLFDQRYRPFGSGISAPGRGIQIQLQIRL